MPHYSYKALDKRGAEKNGVIEAATHQEAIQILKQQDMYPTELHQTAQLPQAAGGRQRMQELFFRVLHQRMKVKKLVPFVNDLAVLTDAGISLTRALTILHNQALARKMKQVITDLRSDIEGGQSLSDALSKHPEIFAPLFINMVRAGELGGLLSEALERLSVLYEKSARLESKVKAALTYPLIVLSFALAVVIFIVAFIVPKFFVIFSDLGTDLPLPTTILYKTSGILQKYWIAILVLLGVGVLAFKLVLTIRPVRYAIDSMKLKLPVFGVLFQKVSIARFCRTFGTLRGSGVPILQTLSVAKDATGNLVMESAIEKVREGIKEGESIAGPLSHYSFFPPLMTNMITVGEETGMLSEMLMKISDRYDDEVDTMVLQLTSLLEPFLILGLGIIVGFIVIALFLPLVAVVQNLTAST